MSAHSSSPSAPSSLPRGAQQQQQPAAGVPVSNPNEMRGVPMAYRQDDGSETPAPVMDTTHRRAYYPASAEEEGANSNSREAGPPPQQQRQLSSPGSVAGSSAVLRASYTVPAASFERRSAAAGEKDGGDSQRRAGTPASSTDCHRQSTNNHNETDSKNHNNDNNADSCGSRNRDREEDSAGASYDAVVKPVFSPFEQLREQQQQQQQRQRQQQQADSQTSDRQVGASAPAGTSSSALYAPPPSYALLYAQPQYSQPNLAHGGSTQYSSYGDSSTPAPNTMPSSATYQSQLYVQQVPYPMPYPLPQPPAEAATAESQRLDTSPVWNTGLFGLNLDPLSSIDAFICGYCISSAHFNVIYREEQGLFIPMIAGLFCVDCCCSSNTLPYCYPWGALAIHTFVIRREVRRRYGIHGNPFIVKNGTAADEVTMEDTNTADNAGATAATDVTATTEAQRETSSPDFQEASSEPSSKVLSKPTSSMPNASSDASAAQAAAAATGGEDIPARQESGVIAESRQAMRSLRRLNALECGADVLISIFCTPCAMAQHHREMALRGEWPGKVVFSRECFCGERDQLPAGMPMTNMF